jgi:hypothetical protein
LYGTRGERLRARGEIVGTTGGRPVSRSLFELLVRTIILGRFARRGRIDGRRGLPSVSADVAFRTPTLQNLADEVAAESGAVRARHLSDTASLRVELAELSAPGGQLTRAEQRLAAMVERLKEVKATPVETGARFGEWRLTDELIGTRREREHLRRLKQALKRVEDERTALATLRSHQRHLEQTIIQAKAAAEAEARWAGAERRSQATVYLNGASRTHPRRHGLSAVTTELMPWPDASSGAQREDPS